MTDLKCTDCIWCDQCGQKSICDFYDEGGECMNSLDKAEYYDEWLKYLECWNNEV